MQHTTINELKRISETELVAMLREGKRTAYEYLYDHYAGALYHAIHMIVRDNTISEDVLQETFIKIWNSLALFDPLKGRLFTWMLCMSKNLAIDKIRSKDYRNALRNCSMELGSYEISKVYSDNGIKEEHIGLDDLLHKMSPMDRFMIDLVFFKGFTNAEIATGFDMPLGTVKSRIRRALSSLRGLEDGLALAY